MQGRSRRARMAARAAAQAGIRRPGKTPINMLVGGIWDFVCRGPDGAVKWREDRLKNLVTNVGLDHMLDVVFHNQAQSNPWYIGLVKDTPTPSFAAGDTLASHAGWTESEEYSSWPNRIEWPEDAASGQSITNTTTADFAIDASDTIAGAFLCDALTLNSGVLFAEVAFTEGDRPVGNGDTLEVKYTLTAADT